MQSGSVKPPEGKVWKGTRRTKTHVLLRPRKKAAAPYVRHIWSLSRFFRASRDRSFFPGYKIFREIQWDELILTILLF